MRITIPETYEQILREQIPDVRAEGLLLRHKKSGARIAVLSCDDDNKVFSIGFRTPPADSTGVAHITEHSVLCGSRKFPVKDPFVELVKGSLNTFLNAITYPDKTIYPVASCNDADFRNLTDVYLDAVFHPNTYQNEKIFRQEGWHYHLEKAEDPLTVNGVVYNEMKGAYSSAEEILQSQVMKGLFPDTPYGVDSGGDPACIPDLTYEAFLDFHRTWYHPSNSYIYLYGNMDVPETLEWMDREYLSCYDAIPVVSQIPMQEAFERPRRQTAVYPVTADEPLENNTYLSRSVVAGDFRDVRMNLAFGILEYVLLDAPGAPVKQALLDAGIGKDVDGSYIDGTLQPVFDITAKNADETDADRFLEVIEEALRKQADEGIDRKALASGINYFEFRFREADYAGFPKGLFYGIDAFSSWLYDDMHPFDYLKQLDHFDELKKLADTGYFEDLVRTWLLDSPHTMLTVLKPQRGLSAASEEQFAAKMAEVKASLSAEEIDRLVEETAALAAYQEEEDTEEALSTIPMLKRSDISPKTAMTVNTVRGKVDGTDLLQQDYETNGIGYLTLLFDAEKVPHALTPYLGLLKSVLGMIRTERRSHTELFHEINASTGGIVCGLQTLPRGREEPDDVGHFRFGVRAKYLFPKQDFVFAMIEEILLQSKLDDTKRLYEIIASQKARLAESIPSSGSASAARRAMSYFSRTAGWNEMTSGIDYYHVIEQLEKNFEAEKDEIVQKLQQLCVLLFRPENLTVSITCAGTLPGALEDNVRHLKSLLHTEPVEEGSYTWKPDRQNEGFRTSGQVQYVAQAGNFKKAGFAYSGRLRILKSILNYDYLWLNLRVLGGAYGMGASFGRTGDCYLTSYRDPHLKRTLQVYADLPEFVRGFEADETGMTRYIIGTISELDSPLNASAKGEAALGAWYAGLTVSDFQQERDEILQASDADIRALAELTEAVLAGGSICVIGSEAVLEKDADALQTIIPLVTA